MIEYIFVSVGLHFRPNHVQSTFVRIRYALHDRQVWWKASHAPLYCIILYFNFSEEILARTQEGEKWYESDAGQGQSLRSVGTFGSPLSYSFENSIDDLSAVIRNTVPRITADMLSAINSGLRFTSFSVVGKCGTACINIACALPCKSTSRFGTITNNVTCGNYF